MTTETNAPTDSTETDAVETDEQKFEREAGLLPFVLSEQDDVTKAITTQVLMGLVKIKSANELLNEDNRTSASDIDKALKDYKGDSDELKQLISNRVEADKAAKAAKDAVQNFYRVNVLGEEEVASSDVDVESVKASRKVVLDALTALKGFAQINRSEEVLNWIDTLQIPMVGRDGISMIGKKRARVLVTIGTTIYQSFGEAAKALTNDDSVEGEVTSTDLNMAWSESSESPEFIFRGKVIKVQPKPTKAEAEKADQDVLDFDPDSIPADSDVDDASEADSDEVDAEADAEVDLTDDEAEVK